MKSLEVAVSKHEPIRQKPSPRSGPPSRDGLLSTISYSPAGSNSQPTKRDLLPDCETRRSEKENVISGSLSLPLLISSNSTGLRAAALPTQRRAPLGFSCDRLRVSGGAPRGVCVRACVSACTCWGEFCTLARVFGSRSSVCVGALASFFFISLRFFFFPPKRTILFMRVGFVWMDSPFLCVCTSTSKCACVRHSQVTSGNHMSPVSLTELS